MTMTIKIEMIGGYTFSARVIDALTECLHMPYEVDDSRMVKRFEADGRNFKSPKHFGEWLMGEINDWVHYQPLNVDAIRHARRSNGCPIFKIINIISE